MTILPGEVHLADLFEVGMRPVIIVSREQLNRGTRYLGVFLMQRCNASCSASRGRSVLSTIGPTRAKTQIELSLP